MVAGKLRSADFNRRRRINLTASPPDGRRLERRVIAVDETEAGNYVPVLRGPAPGEKVVSSGAIILSGSAT